MSMVETLCKTASEIKYDVQKLSTELKNRALLTAADKLVENSAGILEANRNVVDGFLGTKSYAVVSEGGSRIRNVESERIEAMMASQPSDSTYL